MSVKYEKAIYVVSLHASSSGISVMVKTEDQRDFIRGPKERRIIKKAIVDGLLVGFAAPEGYSDPYSRVKCAVI